MFQRDTINFSIPAIKGNQNKLLGACSFENLFTKNGIEKQTKIKTKSTCIHMFLLMK